MIDLGANHTVPRYFVLLINGDSVAYATGQPWKLIAPHQSRFLGTYVTERCLCYVPEETALKPKHAAPEPFPSNFVSLKKGSCVAYPKKVLTTSRQSRLLGTMCCFRIVFVLRSPKDIEIATEGSHAAAGKVSDCFC